MVSQRVIIGLSLTASLAIHATAFMLALEYAGPLPVRLAEETTDRQPSVSDAPPQAPIQPPLPIDPNELIVGTFMGLGDANEDTIGETQTALESIVNQANLSRDPQGARNAGAQAKRQQMAGLTVPEAQELKGVGAQQGMNRLAIGLPGVRQGENGKSTDPKSTSKQIEQAKGSPDEQNPAPPKQGAEQATPGEQAGGKQGQERPHSDTDSDLFSEELDIEMRAGRLVARSGREVKFASPRINLAARADAVTINFPVRLRLRIEVDETGTVRRVTLLNSSGSASIDRAIELSVYETWIEPAKRDGKPIRQTVTTTYSIY